MCLQRCLVVTWLVPRETVAISPQVLCTRPNYRALFYGVIRCRIRRVHVCLAVICRLKNDRDLLRATAVTRGWNGYRSKSQHRNLILEKIILPPLMQGIEPVTFGSHARRSTIELCSALVRGGNERGWHSLV